jgi:hypothetical protein
MVSSPAPFDNSSRQTFSREQAPSVIRRPREYVAALLDEQIEVATCYPRKRWWGSQSVLRRSYVAKPYSPRVHRAAPPARIDNGAGRTNAGVRL